MLMKLFHVTWELLANGDTTSFSFHFITLTIKHLCNVFTMYDRKNLLLCGRNYPNQTKTFGNSVMVVCREPLCV